MTLISTPKNPAQKLDRLVLDNGITIILMENQATDLVACRLFLKNAGSRWDSFEKAGLSHLTAAVLTKGTGKLSSQEIAERVESVGATLSADTSTDYFLIGLKTVSADFAEILQLAGEVMRSPSFPETEVMLEKKLTAQNIRSQLEQPFNVAFNNLREMMYPNHPYGMSILGTEETVASLSREDLVEYHQTYFRPDNLIVSLSGRIDLDRAVTLIDRVFGDWRVSNAVNANLSVSDLQSQPTTKTTIQDTQQAIVMLGYLTASVNSPDYAALKLLSTYLGNGLSSRLFVELREKRGLAYDVSAFYPTRLDRAQFVAYMGTAPQNKETAIEGLRSEVERLCQTQLSEEELTATKNKILGQYALGKQTNSEIAQIYGWYETLGIGIDFDRAFQENVAAVTAETAREVACKYLHQPYLSLVGPE
ncbi:MAG: M16 family metallopeptidase [Xenococcaceae cyanobacterium]